MSITSPNSSVITSPVMLDAEIKALQLAMLNGLSWLDMSFGRAWKQKDADNNAFPEVWQGELEINEDYFNCFPNDFFKSFCFFYCPDNEQNIALEYPIGSYYAERNVRLIFFVDLLEIDETKKYIYTEELKADVLEILKQNLKNTSTLNAYYDTIDSCYDGFSLKNIASQYYDRRYTAMRFDLTLKYYNAC